MATLRDIAQASGFSMTTVSRALNDFDDVNAETKEAIRQVARQLNYRPNVHAKSLANKKSNRIGFIIFDFGYASGEDNFVYEMMLGMQKICVNIGYELVFLFGSVHYSDKEPGLIEKLFHQYNLEGLVIMGLNNQSAAYEDLMAINRPIVCIDSDFTTPTVGCVTITNAEAIEEIVHFLRVQKKRKKLMMLNGKLHAYASQERLRGFREALGDAFRPETVHYGDYSEQKSIDIMQGLLASGQFDYDAIVCSNDMMAIGAIKVLTSYGYMIGRDVDVTGFDNIIISQYIATPLTTVNQDKQLMGRTAIQLLMDIILERATSMRIILPYSIVYRATT